MHGIYSYRIGVFPHHPFVFLFAHCMKFLALHYLPLDASFVKTFTESHMFNLLLLICLIYCANRDSEIYFLFGKSGLSAVPCQLTNIKQMTVSTDSILSNV